MRKVFGVLSFIFLPVLALAAPLKVVCWNLQWFPGGSPEAKQSEKRAHMKKAQEALKILNPDVLCLQEVKDWKAVQELVSVIPGLTVAIVSRFRGDQQQAITSRLPADSAWAAEWQSSAVLDLPRGYSFAALKLPAGGFLLVYSLHMKANSGGGDDANIAKREEASRQLLAHAIEMQKLYGQRGAVAILLAGDWNTTLDSGAGFDSETTLRGAIASGFRSCWDGVPFDQRITHPGEGKWPSITFDHILTIGLETSGAVVQPFPGVSDHNPVVLMIKDLAPALAISTPTPTPEPQPKESADPVAVEKAPTEGNERPLVREIQMSVPTIPMDYGMPTSRKSSPTPTPIP